MVSMPSLHFFRLTEQLRDSGHEVFWFDITGMGGYTKKLSWLEQKTNWKLKCDYKGRSFIKNNFPRIYKLLQSCNERDTSHVFEKYLQKIQPDVVHSFALQLSCLPILDVMNNNHDLKWIFSSWGSDVFYSREIGIDDNKLQQCFRRIDYLITDCKRDYDIAVEKGFKKKYLGVFPGNGGIDFCANNTEANIKKRNIILIKGYNDEIGRGINIIKAFEGELIEKVKDYEIIIFGADKLVEKYIAVNECFRYLNYTLHLKNDFISNSDLIALMGKSYLYIANSLSDGIPNALIEAMGMGAFPIQSNPGNVTEEIIDNNVNGFLINDPENIVEIKKLIIEALDSKELVFNAFTFNVIIIRKKYQRVKVRKQILKLYEEIAHQIN